ncbi:MAG: amidohydrolase family protein [Candidatus Eremiobacteraeota bacterium]|nr:amidohydrolase family protein [Candidatus Eremiobacteraeota bacterium]MBV8499963.1 amidohydrolase family protein [Candidatus Eremiobacteraeota bacterium]
MRIVSEFVRCARALVGGELREDYAFVVRNGDIVAAGDFRDVRDAARDLDARAFPADRLVVPGFVNGHSHAYQILLRGWADDRPFAKWRADALYRVVPRLTPDDVYWTFVAAFGEMLAAGITTVAEFFYLNGSGNAHAEAAIRAARDTGIRLVLARAWMDADYAPKEFRERIDVAAERTRELMERYPEANVCVAPHSLHAASHDMIRAAAEFSRERDCMLHIHVAEAPYEGDATREATGRSPVQLLEELGALGGRTVAIHAIYVSQDDRERIARSGARVIHNPMTNQYLGDGICDVVALQSLRVPTGLGTDADVRPSLIDEMRAAALLQKILYLDGAALGARCAFDLGTAQGAGALRVGGGELVAPQPADYVVLDASNIDPWSPPCNAVVYRGEDAWVQATFVGGRRVYVGEPSPLVRRARDELAATAKRLA